MIDIPLQAGWRLCGTTARPNGLRIMDAEGNVVPGISSITIHADHHGYPTITVGMYPDRPREEEEAEGTRVGAVMDNATNDEG